MKMVQLNIRYLICGLLIVFFLISLVFLSSKPLIWSDEAIYVDMVDRLLTGKGLSTHLFRDFIPAGETYSFWYPPGYFYLLALIFKLFGTEILVARLLSLNLAILTLLLMYFLAKDFLQSRYARVFLLILLVTDKYFQDCATIARMEILVLFLGLAAIFSYRKFWQEKQYLYLLLSGLLAGLNLLVHPNALLFIVSISLHCLLQKKFFRQQFLVKIKCLLIFSSPILLCLLGWGLSFIAHWDIFLLQNAVQATRKLYGKAYILTLLPIYMDQGLILLAYYLSNGFFILRLLLKKNLTIQQLFCLLLISLSSFWPIVFKEMWYIVFFSFFAAVTVLSNVEFFWQRRQYFLASSIIICLMLNLIIYINTIAPILEKSANYDHYCAPIVQKIPAHAQVLISAFPDPYFCLVKARQDLDLREVPNSPPGEPVNVALYNQILATVDYVIYSYVPNKYIYDYLVTNTETILFTSSQDSAYPVKIIQLKPVLERQPL